MSGSGAAVAEREQPVLLRENLSDLLEGVRNPDSGLSRTWNVVDAIELLLDAGQFKVARQLSEYICGLLRDDDRQRLFIAYQALCGIVIDGELKGNLVTIDGISDQISFLGHSQADRVRISLVRARALGMGVAMRALPESEILTARSVIESQYRSALSSGKHTLALLAGVELLKTYIYSFTPELIAARGIINQLATLVEPEQQTSDVRCDLARFRYHVESLLSGSEDNQFVERRLRSEVHGLGALARALAELSIARISPQRLDREILEGAQAVFVENGHLAAASEAALLLAGQSFTLNHFARAQRFFSTAGSISEQGGSLYVSLTAMLGLFQSVFASGGTDDSRAILREITARITSDLGITAFGVNVVSALQISGDCKSGYRLARKCLATARSLRVLTLEQESLFRIAGCLAGVGDWKGAATNYRLAASCAAQRRDLAGSSEMLLSGVQASLMALSLERGQKPALAPDAFAACQKQLREVDAAVGSMSARSNLLPLRARVEQLHGELLSLSGDALNSVKRFSEARRLFVGAGLPRAVALVDACSGVGLLEVAKVQGAPLWDEVFSAFQRALEYFEQEREVFISWKIKYYLALTAFMRSRREGDLPKRLMWLEVSHSWLEGAGNDRRLLEESQRGMPSLGWGHEFAPSVLPDALDALAQSLRKVRSQDRPRVVKRGERRKGARFRGQLH